MSVQFRFDPNSLKLSIAQFQGAMAQFKANGRGGMEQAARVFALHVQRNITERDHSIRDLARMDHPYAKRHKQIKPIHNNASHIRDGRHIIHTRSGKLASALKVAARGDKHGVDYLVHIDPAVAPHIRHVLKGTKKMLPRYPIQETAMSPVVQAEIRTTIILFLRRTFGRSRSTP